MVRSLERATPTHYAAKNARRASRNPRRPSQLRGKDGAPCPGLCATGTRAARRCTTRITSRQPTRATRAAHPPIRLPTATWRVLRRWGCMIHPALGFLARRTGCWTLRMNTRTMVLRTVNTRTTIVIVCWIHHQVCRLLGGKPVGQCGETRLTLCLSTRLRSVLMRAGQFFVDFMLYLEQGQFSINTEDRVYGKERVCDHWSTQ